MALGFAKVLSKSDMSPLTHHTNPTVVSDFTVFVIDIRVSR